MTEIIHASVKENGYMVAAVSVVFVGLWRYIVGDGVTLHLHNLYSSEYSIDRAILEVI